MSGLKWPDGWVRTPSHMRQRSKFDVDSPGRVLDDLVDELRLFRVKDVVVSTDVPTNMRGLPFAEGLSQRILDPGVAVYFKRGPKAQVLACDTYVFPVENVRAITLCVEAMRTMDRHRVSQVLDRVFLGLTALPPAMKDRPWWDVLGVQQDAAEAVVTAAYREGAKRFHPDAGGDAEAFQHIARAMEEFRKERGL